jgi:nitroimidazol reductase NimA-like FMN-containing flavoprotein (pyridoxamine 5'-phosphate oxidase superfamily)
VILESQIKRNPERAVPHEASRFLAQGLVAHVSFCCDGQPFVIPFSYHYDPAHPGQLYLHGANESRALKLIGAGAPVCISVTLVDGLVYSRDAKYHSMNYRSVVLRGCGRIIAQESEKAVLFARMVARYFPGRTEDRDYSPPSSGHLKSTILVAVEIEEWSAKTRQGEPKGPHDADPNAPGTCGVFDLRQF